MGFASEDLFFKLYRKERDKKTGEDDEALREMMEEQKRETEIVEGLSDALNKILREHGETIPYDYIIFNRGKSTHLMVRMDASTLSQVKMMSDICGESEQNMNEFLSAAIQSRLDEVAG